MLRLYLLQSPIVHVWMEVMRDGVWHVWCSLAAWGARAHGAKARRWAAPAHLQGRQDEANTRSTRNYALRPVYVYGLRKYALDIYGAAVDVRRRKSAVDTGQWSLWLIDGCFI